jgi:hypothetical protein
MNGLASSTLEAATIGPEVPLDPCAVSIHSVFPNAINLQPALGGILITILNWPSPEYPQSIRLNSTEDFTAHGLQPNSSGLSSQAGISLDRSGAPPLHLSFAKAIRLPRRPLPSLRQAGAAWKAAVLMLAGLQVRAGTDLRVGVLLGHDSPQGALGLRLTAAVTALGEAVRAGAPDRAARAIPGLVGLGSGLTPSGDDFLCGFLIAAHCRFVQRHDPVQLLLGLKTAVLECLPSTNAISATFLRCAAEGKACGDLHDLAQSLHDGTPSSPALTNLCAYGHSSGMDIATGFLYGMSLWE